MGSKTTLSFSVYIKYPMRYDTHIYIDPSVSVYTYTGLKYEDLINLTVDDLLMLRSRVKQTYHELESSGYDDTDEWDELEYNDQMGELDYFDGLLGEVIEDLIGTPRKFVMVGNQVIAGPYTVNNVPKNYKSKDFSIVTVWDKNLS